MSNYALSEANSMIHEIQVTLNDYRHIEGYELYDSLKIKIEIIAELINKETTRREDNEIESFK